MLSDLERDVLYLLEQVPGFEGLWRLPPSHGEDRYELAAGVRDCVPWRVHLETLKVLHPSEHARLLVFDSALRTPVFVERGIRLVLDDASRSQARAAVARREPFSPQPCEAPQARRLLVVEREAVVWSQLRERVPAEVVVDRSSSAYAAMNAWWWSNRGSPADVVVMDLRASDAVELAPSIVFQPRYVDRVFFVDDGSRRFPFFPVVRSPLRDVDVDAISGALLRPRVRDMTGPPPDLPCVLVVEAEPKFNRVVRRAIVDAEVVRVATEWDALDLVAMRRVDCVFFVFSRAGDAARFTRFQKIFVELRATLRDRVLFVTSEEAKRSIEANKPAVAHRFVSNSIAPDALREMLAG